MELKATEVKISDCLTVGEYVKKLKVRTGNDKISNQSIHYHFNSTDQLDWVNWSGLKMVVMNEKAKKFTPGQNYGNASRIANKVQI